MSRESQDFLEDLALLKAAETDAAAFDLVMTRFEAPVFRFARSLVRNDEDAEDVLQQTFLSIWDALQKKAGPKNTHDQSAKSWIFTIARHAAYRKGRRRVGEPQECEPLTSAELATLGVEAGWGSDETPESIVEKLESQEQVQRSLSQLPEEYREVILLRDVEELTTQETAQVLGLSPAAVKSKLHRARLKLSAILRHPPQKRKA